MTPKETKAAYMVAWRDANKEKCRQHAKKGKIKLLAKLRAWYRGLKTNSKCKVCGESHPACIEFHHRDPSQKDKEISVMVRDGCSIKRIEKELTKCDVLCSNCHSKLHWGESYVELDSSREHAPG